MEIPNDCLDRHCQEVQVQKAFSRMNGDVGMGYTPCDKNFCGNKEIPLLSRMLAQSCITPLPELRREGLRMIVLVFKF